MNYGTNLQLRPAVLTDQRALANLIHFSPHVHRHLDWRNPLDWIGTPPYYVIETQGQIVAALGCPPDPPAVAWVRLFANSGKIPTPESWTLLWGKVRADLAGKGSLSVAAILLQDWLEEILVLSGFTSHQSIIMLEREGSAAGMSVAAEVSIRAMMPFDLPTVAEVDAAAFELLWQNSLPALERAYPQAIIATVAEVDDKIIGYQISTRNPYGVHLARLAVLPTSQGQGVGYGLVADLIQQAGQRGLSRITVNTQSDNATSRALIPADGIP